MKQPEPQPQMPREKFRTLLFIFAVGCVLTAIIKWGNVSDDLGKFLLSIATSFFIVSGVELAPELYRYMTNRSLRGQFRSFFGDMAVKDDVRLVFSHRTLKPEFERQNPFITHYDAELRKIMEEERDAEKDNGGTEGSNCVLQPEGINGWLAFQDVQAAVYVTNMFSQMTSRQVRAVHDKSIADDQKDFCIVSFGLGFNAFTHAMANYFEPRIFRVNLGKSPKDANFTLTDNFLINEKQVPIPDRLDIAIVARIVPPGDREVLGRVWFVCAGRTAAGTAAAGYFLANKWQSILELYKTHKKDLSRDSVVVVVQHLQLTDACAGGTYDHTAAILHGPEGQPVMQWGVATGVPKGRI